jgi:hypothetical protein
MDRTDKRKAAAGDDPVPAHAIAECAAIPARTNAYKNQALDLLKTKFPRLSVAAIPACEIEVACGCCFGETPSEATVQCDQGKHFFCFGCVQHYVQEQLFCQDTSMVQCISSNAGGCKAGFSTVQLTRALTDDVLKAYDMHQSHTEIVKANIVGLW